MRTKYFLFFTLLALVSASSSWAQYDTDTEPDYAKNIEPVYSMEPNNPESAINPQPAQQVGTAIAKKSVTVYGRETCGWTVKYMKDLQKAGIPYVFKNVDDPAVNNEMWKRLGNNTSSTGLPVIDNNGQVSSRPDLKSLLAKK
jgi:glutaredoxin